MCGRFTLAARLEQLQERYEIQSVSQHYAPDYKKYNVAPTQVLPAVRMNTRLAEPKELFSATWGFSIGSNTVINSRVERLEATKTYQRALRTDRCLIPATGFYEWKTLDNKKLPYYFKTTDQEIYSFAGLYQEKTDEQLGCTILTTTPNSLVEKIHDRMPVILRKEAEELWLDRHASTTDLLECLVPYPTELMESYQVSTKVNSVKNNDTALIKPKSSLQDFIP